RLLAPEDFRVAGSDREEEQERAVEDEPSAAVTLRSATAPGDDEKHGELGERNRPRERQGADRRREPRNVDEDQVAEDGPESADRHGRYVAQHRREKPAADPLQ